MIVHLNGKLLPSADARVSPFDRGFLFGDGLYEGLRAFDARVVALDLHIKRLSEGLREIALPWDAAALPPLTRDLLNANNLRDAFIYWQVTRGTPGPGRPVRSRIAPPDLAPTVFGYAVPAPPLSAYPPVPAKSAVTVLDTRWHRGHVKSISLLGNVLGSMLAHDRGADDALFVRDNLDTGQVAEGTSANLIAALPQPDGTTQLVTPPLSTISILKGVTRDLLLARSPSAPAERAPSPRGGGGLPIIERPLFAHELPTASELMLCGTLTMVTSITTLNNRPVGDGKPGPMAHALLHRLIDLIKTG